MAGSQAIAATGQAILGLLADACPKPEFATARFELYQSSNFQNPMDEGISLFLYRIEVNAGLRNVPTNLAFNGERRRPPLPLDLSYVLTAWAKNTVKQQRLLGWAMRMLEDVSVLSAGLLNQYSPERNIFRAHETVELIFQTLSLQDLSNLWNIIKANPPTSVTYIARVVGIESEISATEAAPVQTREFDLARK
ncbi:MAG: DUF4255 domain-containing protein [Pyrinomonadaceae bacterium]